ncbi:intermembrane lipid transfer protein VPS13C-like isoform X2 [Acipenser ruthenus]|uniref:intermembrane lipid transfer protein VPS13C-like isoform X2 n=1 Tax=Acipenser ruthenus TaxID=7906 RepID=UPI002740F8AA|nr:intermembrane lipid transfer protein VPS13C-like isoform X2 [Acipenser ruthenus]
MVFESLVADLLNKFIGDYVENLDKSQLKLGIWGGNVVLENLKVKENALSEFNVPFKVKAGQIGKLILKIPWKNLYNDAVVATLDGLYLLVVPGASIKYDAAKEEKFLQEAKQKELLRIEEALQIAAARGTQTGDFLFDLESYVYKDVKPGRKHKKHKKHFKKSKRREHKQENPKDEKKDSFQEKLLTQVIKNLQVKITNIHIRYEDDITDPEQPFSMGVTLEELSLQTADENWKPCILNNADKIIYKLVRLDCLCAYWNVKSRMFYRGTQEDILGLLKEGIASSVKEPKDYQYIFRPIFASAKLCINPHAEIELKSPKMYLDMEVQSIAIEMTKPQYLSMIDLLESVDCMVKNAPYRKYRPELPLHNNARKWWGYAITSISEVHIRRPTQMWLWSSIKKHRQHLRAYKTAYKTKLTQSKCGEETLKQLQDLEKTLDVFNITLARQQAHVEVIRSGQKMLEKKATQKEKQGGGWFGGFFGKKEGKKKAQEEESSAPESIDEFMTAEEKAKLYTAIGYSGSSHNLALPKEYVASVMTFKLLSTSITVREEPGVPETLKVQMISLSTSISQRPGAQALKVEAKLEHWYVTGLQQRGAVPSLIASVGDATSSLLHIRFETNPEGSTADQLLVVQSQPVEIIYDARTVIGLAEFFQSAQGIDLEMLTSATLMKLEEIKEKTATGLSHIIETRKVLDLQVNLKPSYLLVPQTGFYDGKSNLVILDFGSLQLNSVNQGGQQPLSPSFNSLEEIMDRAYEKFDLELQSVQLLYCKSGESWKDACHKKSSKLHILQPMDIKVQLAKSMVDKDARMAKFKVSGELPLLHVRMSDQKIKEVMELAESIPLPQRPSTPTDTAMKVPAISLADARTKVRFEKSLNAAVLLEAGDTASSASDEDISGHSPGRHDQRLALPGGDAKVELTDLLLKFEIKEVLVELTRQESQETVLALNIAQLGTEVKLRPYDLTVTSYLKKVTLDYCEIRDPQNWPIHLISSSDKPGSDLLKVEFIKADNSGPNFKATFDNTEQTLKVAFSSLNLLLHTQALLSTISFMTAALPSSIPGSAGKDQQPKSQGGDSEKGTVAKTVSKGSKDKAIFDLKVFAVLDSFHVVVCDERRKIADIKVQGLDASVFVQTRETQVSARLRDIIVTDIDSSTIHHKAVSIVGGEVFSFNMALYPNATEGDAYTDTSKVDGKVTLRVGCIQIVYLHKFLMSLLDLLSYKYSSSCKKFVDNFQTAKEALSVATVQAAEKAASSVRDFAQKSFRLSMDIKLKAPVIVIPQSSVSQNAVEVDLGLITVQNQFCLVPADGCSLPPVIDKMDVQLTKLKLSRVVLQGGSSQPDIEILQPINLDLAVNRNLAASWYNKIPAVEIKGGLETMNVVLSQEDLGVLMKILVENIAEGSKELSGENLTNEKAEDRSKTPGMIKLLSSAAGETGSPLVNVNTSICEEVTKVLLSFEIKKVVVKLTKPVKEKESPFLVLHLSKLGTETRVRNYDLSATAYLKKINMKYLGFTGEPLNIIRSSDEPGADLLKVEYYKADKNGPDFKTVYNNTEQMISVAFSSLDLLLHTQALLSSIHFLTAAMSSSSLPSADKERDSKIQAEEQSKSSAIKPVSAGSETDGDVIDLKLTAKLGAFNVLVCDENCDIADIRIRGIDASVSMQSSQTQVFARLRDIIVTDVDSKTIHKKAVSIVGGEVFSFNMALYPNATEGDAYTDTSNVDGKVTLRVGCIQIVYLHKFLMSLMNFSNNFQTAKEALSVATAQAAEKAASSVRDFAQKSFRLSMDIKLKAPVIVIPQSSVSQNAVEVDLGLITVQNQFCLVPADGCSLPPVIDKMDVQLTKLKLSRILLQEGSVQPNIELLQPVNLRVSVKRNLAAAWYQKMPAIEINGDLKPMKVALSQDDLTVLLKIVMENIGEASNPQTETKTSADSVQKQGGAQDGSDLPKGSAPIKKEESNVLDSKELYETLKFDFNFESLSLVLYNSDPTLKTQLSQRQDSLRLGEFILHLMTASGKMFEDGALEASTKLTACTLDDCRKGIQRVTSRMVDKKDDGGDSVMIDLSFTQSQSESSVVAVLQKLYVCASVEFLLAVADFFIKAMPQGPSATPNKSNQLQLKQVNVPRAASEKAPDSSRPKMKIKAVVIDTEVVFVASLMKADAPALAASFQCDFTLVSEGASQKMTASLRELKVLACPFLRDKGDKAVTTVLRPACLTLETRMHQTEPLTAAVTVDAIIVKISPMILNTVMTIVAAMTPKAQEVGSQQKTEDVSNLWAVKNLNNCSYWFLGVDMASEVTDKFSDREGRGIGENLVVDVKLIQVTMESGLGHRTVPLLLAESSFKGKAQDWTSLLNVSADMTLEVHYYNEVQAAWEPLIERVEDGRRRWNLKLEMKNNPIQDKSPVPGDDFVVLPEAQTAINICSKDTMNITISKCCLHVFTNLAKAFSEGTATTFDHSLKEKAPYTIKNALGIPLEVQHSSNLRALGSVAKERIHEVGVGQSVKLEYAVIEHIHRGRLSALQRQESCLFSLSIVPSGYSEIANIPIAKPSRRLYNVRSPMFEDAVSVVTQIDATEGNKVITVRSPLQIKNHFSIPFAIYKLSMKTRSLEPVGEAEPEKEFHVPLDSYRCQLFLRPVGMLNGQFKESSTFIAWKEELHRSSEVRAVLQCPSSEINYLPLIVNTVAVPDELSFISSHGEEDWDPAYLIHLRPTVTIRNLLPYTICYLLEGAAETHELAEGSSADVHSARISGEIMELVLVKYQGRNWSGHMKIHEGLPEFFLVCFTSNSLDSLSVDLSVHVGRASGQMVLSVFSPYWIINKTSRVLQYRAEEIQIKHPSDFRDIILFSFKKKNIFSKNKVQLCVSTSTWSSSFSLDTVGSYGCVKCPANNMDYLVGVSIQMSSFNLTRIVMMSPFYTLVNKSSFELEVGEVQTTGTVTNGKWHYIAAAECLPLWPETTTGKLCVRVVGSETASKSFFFNKQDNGTLLGMDLCGGIIAAVNIADHATVISFSDYYEGAAPALIINHTLSLTLKYQQSGNEELGKEELKPGEAKLFAWNNPAAIRKLSWSCPQQTGELDLLKDESGQFCYNQNTQIHWVSFLDGRQRVLLFTEDVAIVTKARQAEEMEQFEKEINVSLQNLGLSLINNETKQEISYIGITSSGAVWEMKPKQRWKPFNQKNINLLEQTYQKHLSANKQPGWIKLENNFEVNFTKFPMEMRHPFACNIRRNFLSGIQAEFKQSPHQRSLRAQVHWLQVDNQLPGAIFPIVFHPVPPPKSIALDSEPKPFIDVSIITRFNEHSQVMQFKYFMALVQEMALKIDQGFLGAIIALFTPATDLQADKQKTKLIEQDLEALKAELMETSITDTSGLGFFEHLHISPIKLHLSLSLDSGEESDKQDMVAIQSINLLLKSIGATLTDVDDLIFKLACFEVRYKFYRRDQLMWTVSRHYGEQFLKQMYVLVLGLDVLGNPFGLIRGLSEGVEAFFYEPFQGAVQGPEEFAEGFVIGVRSLLGHTVGGAAGVVSRITGSVGKGLAAITMDKEYQQKRREEMNRQPKDFGDSLAKGGKGLLWGVVGGVTGIVTKPVEGAKKEGAAGFFKGLGKGLVGVVARPTGGIVDMASSTFQGIQRVAESTEEVSKIRPPRLIREDGIIRPFNQGDAEGYDLFQRSEIKKLEGELFREHCKVPGSRKTSLVVTNRRVMCLKEIDFVDHINKDWECLFENFTRPPSLQGSSLNIYTKNQGIKMFQNKDSQDSMREVPLQNPDIAWKMCSAIDEAKTSRQQHQLVKQKSRRFIKQNTLP